MLNNERWRNRLQLIERKYFLLNRYLLILILISFFIGGASFAAYQLWIPVKIQKSEQLADLQQQLHGKAQQLASRNLELSLEREANSNMRQMFVQQKIQQQALNKELSFYRSIMAPKKNAQGIYIFDLQLTPSIIDSQYDLALILTQQKKRRSSLKGKAELTLIGVKNGKEIKRSINKLTNESFAFKFRFFQTLETRLSLPNDVDWKKITIKVSVPASRWVKAQQTERTFDMNSLLTNEVEPIETSQSGVILEQNTKVLDNSTQSDDARGNNDGTN
ncbi:MAG: DUF6776 family protein [Parashewanella sp.]